MTRISLDKIDFWYINLSHRGDRLAHIRGQLAKAGILAQRFNATRKEDLPGWETDDNFALMRATPNTLGNWFSHTELIGKAKPGHIVGVLEDDGLICSDFRQRIKYLQDNLRFDWDIFFLGATVHVDDPQWHKTDIGKDCEPTDLRHVWRTYDAFSNQGYLINGDSSEKILEMMAERMPHSRGSDHALIQIQPKLNCYCFIPGMVFQIDGPSDIGEGITQFSHFRTSLGEYVYAERLEDFDYDKWIEGRK